MDLYWTCFLALMVNVIHSFTLYHELSKIVFTASVKLVDDANFGFSISSVSKGAKSKLIVGAPLADNVGKVYTCDLISDTTCTSIDSMKRYFNDKENYWFGATVMGTDNYFVSCAPRVYDQNIHKVSASDSDFGSYGRCFTYEKSTLSQVKSLTQDQRNDSNSNMTEHTFDSFGWSLFLGPSKSILIGGPAVTSGRVLQTKKDSASVIYTNGTSSNTKFNFGYAVTSGNFLSSKTSIAVGSPYGTAGLGKVIFLAEENKAMQYKLELVGDAAGSMFGAVLCPVKLNVKQKNRLTDLLVGAPTYTPEGHIDYNVGAVYVYITQQSQNTVFQAPKQQRVIIGASTNSHFGSAIVSLGDFNNDDMDEIAIAAPYENEGQGTVYLYSGADIMADGILKPIQKITPDSVLNLRSFGYSLTVLRDYDDNGCNELAIGAPESNKVMVLRCPAAITIQLLKFNSNITGITDGKDKYVSLDLCFNAEFPAKPPVAKADILVQVQIYHDSARLASQNDGNVTFKINHNQNTDANRKARICQNISLILSAKPGNFKEEIEYYLSATPLNDVWANEHFDSSKVILSKNSELSLSSSLWVQECGDKECVPELNMTTEFSTTSPYLIGSTPSINVSIKVNNTGDVAYDPCVRVNVAGVGMPDVCTVDANNLLLCKPKQLLRQYGSWNLETIVLDTSKLTNEDKNITVTVKLFNDCELKKVANRSSEVFQLYADTDSVEVNGRTNEGQDHLVNLTRTDIMKQKTFEHIYTISNSGPTNWVNIPMTIRVQKQDFYTVSLIDKSCKAMTSTDSASTLEYSCTAPTLNNNAKIEMVVRMKVVSDNLEDRIGKERLTVHSELFVKLASLNRWELDRTIKNSSVTSELRLVEGKTPIWIIIVASILAMILLIIIFFILKKCGFLERKNREQLKQVRMSVRRQTVMRKSTEFRPRSEDHEALVNDANTIQENMKKQKDRRVVVE